MRKGIVIVTWSGGKDQFENLFNSIQTEYPLYIVVNDGDNAEWINNPYKEAQVIKLPYDGFELGAISAVLEQTDLDEFVLLQDTFEIIDNSILKILLENYPDKSVAYNYKFQMYLGKFRRVALSKLEIPQVRDKIESVRNEEAFTNSYREIEPVVVFNTTFNDECFMSSWEHRWGRKNLVMRDEYLIKRKGLWSAHMLYE